MKIIALIIKLQKKNLSNNRLYSLNNFAEIISFYPLLKQCNQNAVHVINILYQEKSVC